MEIKSKIPLKNNDLHLLFYFFPPQSVLDDSLMASLEKSGGYLLFQTTMSAHTMIFNAHFSKPNNINQKLLLQV